jgi:glycosyltransferase involved in cell wall biosynthesis
MHIGIDARSIFTNGGGDRTYFRSLIATMARLSPEDRWTLYAERDDPDRESLRAPNVAIAPALPAPIGGLWNETALRPRLRQDRVDILHSQYLLPPIGFISCPMVVTIHDVTFRLFPHWFPRRANQVQNLLIPRAAQRAACVLTGSQSAADDIARTLHVPVPKIIVTPYGVSTRFMPPDDSSRQRVKSHYGLLQDYLLGVGLLRERKNAVTVVRAVARLREQGRWPGGVILALTGGWGSAPVAAEAVQAHGLTEIVRVLGYVSDDDLPVLYGAALASVYPSLYEGFGLPPLEAMSCGCPTISSDNSALPEVVGDAGILVSDYENPEAWAEVMSSLLADASLRADLSQRGLARAQTFSWERTAQETLHVYRQVAGKD